MLIHQITLQAKNRPEITERILRIVRHRGFRLKALQLFELTPQTIQLTLTIASTRPLHLLTTQLTKLVDIEQLEINNFTQRITA